MVDATIPRWPKQLSPRDFSDPQIAAPTLDSPAPLSGAPQDVMSGAGRWTMQLSMIPIFRDATRDLFATWRALFVGRLQLGFPVLMPARDWFRGPAARGHLPVDPELVPFSDGATFGDTSEFVSGYEDVTVAAAAAYFATSIVVNVDSAVAAAGATPVAGDIVSIDARWHMIAGIAPVDGVANRWTWRIAPPLRKAVAVGDVIEIRDPVCVMRLTTDSRKQTAATRELGRLARVSLNFVEDNWTI